MVRLETPKPTATETSLTERQQIIAWTAAGESAPTIAARLGCSARTIHRWRARYRKQGEEGLQPRSRRPKRRHPQTTPEAVVARIDAIRRRLLCAEAAVVPSEHTIAAWLKRLGYGLVRPPRGTRPGWPIPEHAPSSNTNWQMDHKQKGGSPT